MTRLERLRAFIRSIGPARSLLALVLLVLLTASGCGRVEGTVQLPSQDSTVAADTDFVFYFIYWLCVIYFVHIMGIMAWFMFRYRRRPDVGPQPSAHHNLPLEIAWSIPPAALVVFMFWWGFTQYIDLTTPPADSYKIQVIAKQWDFRFVYPNGVESTELHVPMGEPIEVVLESEDVLHAFYIPKFRVKQDIVPGRFTELWFTATRPSKPNPIEKNPEDPHNKEYVKGVDYWLFCAEYCGTNHSLMRTAVIVHETRAEFDAWLRSMDKPKDGKTIYSMYCASCHTLDGTINVGPSFKGLYGSQRTVLDVPTNSEIQVPADDAYIVESIKNPGTKLSRMGKEFGNLMDQTLANKLKEEEYQELLKFMKEKK